MKIALPTDDGIKIRPGICNSRAFQVATVKSGMIIHKELRWNLLSERLTSELGCFYNLNDCDVLILKETAITPSQIMKLKNLIIVQTNENDITVGLTNYLKCIFHLKNTLNSSC
jgi:predicted Fe-Mo cluster-binding NifX family protein